MLLRAGTSLVWLGVITRITSASDRCADTNSLPVPPSKTVQLLDTIQEMRSLQEIAIHLGSGPSSQRIYQFFTKPHPRYRIIQNKRWGVAILPLPDTFEEYIRGGAKSPLRNNRKRALTAGYSYQRLDPFMRIEEIMEIHRSAAVRQGRPIDPVYLDVHKVTEYFRESGEWIDAVLNKEGKVRAYADVPVYGELASFNRLLGHADDLENGIMYLLISETVRRLIETKAQTQLPRFAMYDTFFGAASGLHYFKRRMGFSAFKIRWSCGVR